MIACNFISNHIFFPHISKYIYLSYAMLTSRLQSITGLSKTIFQAPLLRFSAAAAIKPKMEQHQIVPDVIKVAPVEVAKVNYVSGVSCDLGNELTPTAVKDVPKVEWNADANAFYTLCMTDPDAPSRQEPTYREVLYKMTTWTISCNELQR